MPGEPITAEQVAGELGLGPLTAGETAHLNRLLSAARRMFERRTGHRLEGGMIDTLSGADVDLANQAIVAMVAGWFANPEAVSAAGKPAVEVPLSVTWIIDTLRRWDSGE